MGTHFWIFAAIIFFAIFSRSGNYTHDENLVGTWIWEENNAFVSTFNEDGTGSHAVNWGFGLTFDWIASGYYLFWDYYRIPRMYTRYEIINHALYITIENGRVLRYFRLIYD